MNTGLSWARIRSAVLGAWVSGLAAWGPPGGITAGAAQAPRLTGIQRQGAELRITAEIPPGYGHLILESREQVVSGTREAWVSGVLAGQAGIGTFQVTAPSGTRFLRLSLGLEAVPPAATLSGAPYFLLEPAGGDLPLGAEERVGHVLNRLGYGPGAEDLQAIAALGLAGYIEQQLSPEQIDESGNTALATREEALFTVHRPSDDTRWIAAGDTWRYFKGVQEPPSAWKTTGFDDGSWAQGRSGFGYGDDDDATVLEDMRQAGANPGYLTVYARKAFEVSDPVEDFDALILRVDFDDGFVAYLNGTEVARVNVTANPARFDTAASSDHEAGEPVEFDLTSRRALLRRGINVLAIQGHNVSRTSSDFSLTPEFAGRRYLAVPPLRRIRGIEALQQLVHVRGVYSRRQLQNALAEFWENHFTTDYDKVAEYFYDLRNSDARRAMTEGQAAAEAAQAEYTEYQFFHDHALGNFGDLLLYSATSPAQLIYLDNVLNVKGAPNENYAREILELFAFGVDNRYTQEDIEQLAKCFTGWSVRKISPEAQQPFPASSRTPPTTPGVQFADTTVLGLGPGWRYFKGTREPSPGAGGAATTGWTEPGFDDAAWLAGLTGMGYGDGDDATVLSDMRNGYLSVYLRRAFTVADPAALENLLLSVDYDDGFVAYLNGTEIARSETMEGAGSPPAFNRAANGGREAGRDEAFSLAAVRSLLRPAPEVNVLAIQVHNITRDSSDLSMRPRLVLRELLPGSIENGDPNGIWTFRFNPEQHDTGAKVVFRGTPYEVRVPAGRTGAAGLQDALEVVDTFVRHPSVSEFICLKLINRFVSDEINLTNYRDGTAPAELRQMLDDAIGAWHSTQPAGNIRTVLRTILAPATQAGAFWSRAAYRSKIKTPVEFINSSVRALRAEVGGTSLAAANDQLGMHLFTRDDPDGWSELGLDWIDTGTLLARIQFAQALTRNGLSNVSWNVLAWVDAHGLSSAESIIDHFNARLFDGKMPASSRAVLLQFASTDDAGNPLPWDRARADYAQRVRDLVGLILSMPQWHYQ